MTGGQAVVKALEKEETSIVFGLPGVHVLGIYDALYDSEIRHVLVRHEQSAAFMADAYSRTTGRVGVCLTTMGPGTTNAVTALATAYCDSSPVLLIAGQIPSKLLGKGKGALHEVDQLSILRPLTKWNKCVQKVEDIPPTIRQAFKSMKLERPRPIQIEIPIDILEAPGEVDFTWQEDDFLQKPSGSRETVEDAVLLLANSKAPIILAGGGVLRSGATEELIIMAETLSAPVITTIMGRGAIPDDHPLSLGCLARGGPIEEILAEADVVLALGTRFSATSTKNWTVKFPENLIHVDIDETEIGKNYATKVGIVGDAKLVLQRMLSQLKKGIQTKMGWLHRVMDVKGRMRSALEFSDRTEIRTVLGIRKVLDRNAIVAADVTIPAYWMVRLFEVYQPGTLLYPAGYVAMGFGLPAAIASKLAYPERQVVALCGDGSFMMTCQELATAVENNVNIPIIIYNNQGYGILKYAQKLNFSSRHIGVDLTNPDFLRFAEAFGAKGLKVDAISQLKPCLEEALKSDKPTVIDMRLPPFDPPWGREHYERKD